MKIFSGDIEILFESRACARSLSFVFASGVLSRIFASQVFPYPCRYHQEQEAWAGLAALALLFALAL